MLELSPRHTGGDQGDTESTVVEPGKPSFPRTNHCNVSISELASFSIRFPYWVVFEQYQRPQSIPGAPMLSQENNQPSRCGCDKLWVD